MKNKYLLIISHPNEKSLNYHIFNEITLDLKEKKLDFDKIELYKEEFNPVLEFDSKKVSSKQNKLIKEYQDKISNSNKIILIYSVWWYNVPAMVKGFFDNIFTAGFAFKYGENKMPEGLLKGKDVFIVRTFGSPKIATFLFGNGALKSIKKATFGFCGMKVQKVYSLFGVNSQELSEKKLNNFIEKIKKVIN